MNKAFAWLLVGGMMAYPIEGLWRIPSNGGWVSIAMFPVYGLALFAVGMLNQYRWFYERRMAVQSLIGAFIVLMIEYIGGMIINVWGGLAVWDYSTLPFTDPHGQVSLLFAFFWFLLMPFAIWLEDKVSYVYARAFASFGFHEGETWNYSLKKAYKELFFLP
jgi:uncharacterized membrane protein